MKVGEFIFCDKNCKFKIFSKTKNFYPFSSMNEFFNIVGMLDIKLTASEVFLNDEKDCELFF